MNLEQKAEFVSTRSQLAEFIEQAADTLRDNPDDWDNGTLEQFLRAWSAWVDDMDGYFYNRGLGCPESPSWKLVAQMVLAARVYE